MFFPDPGSEFFSFPDPRAGSGSGTAFNAKPNSSCLLTADLGPVVFPCQKLKKIKIKLKKNILKDKFFSFKHPNTEYVFLYYKNNNKKGLLGSTVRYFGSPGSGKPPLTYMDQCESETCFFRLGHNSLFLIHTYLGKVRHLQCSGSVTFSYLRIRILGPVPLTNGSGSRSCSFRQWSSKCQQIFFFFYKYRYLLIFWYIYIILHRYKRP